MLDRCSVLSLKHRIWLDTAGNEADEKHKKQNNELKDVEPSIRQSCVIILCGLVTIGNLSHAKRKDYCSFKVIQVWDDTLSQQLLFSSFWKHLHQLSTFGFSRNGSIFKSFHRFSLGFKSGLWGCWRTFTFLLWSHSNVDLAACWNPVGGEICWPHSQAFGIQKPALLEICLCLDPSIVPLDPWQSLPVLPVQVWSCPVVLRGEDGFWGLINSIQFQQTQHFASAEAFWLCFIRLVNLCVMLSVFHVFWQTPGCCHVVFFRRGWLVNWFEGLCWQFLSWQVILSWLKNTGD